jgi:hypothetical protein
VGESAGGLQVPLVCGVVPVREVCDEIQQCFTQRHWIVKVQIAPANGIPETGHDGFGVFTELRGAVFLGRVGPEGSAENCPAGGQRPARPPDVQRGDVTVADGLLPAGVGADALDGQIDFDEALGVIRWSHYYHALFKIIK